MGSSSCASFVSRSSYPVSLTSIPSESKVTITNQNGLEVFSGQTPTTAILKADAGFFKKATYNITYNKAGFQEKTITLTTSLDGWYFGNIFLGGLIGMLIVDPATGAMWKLDASRVNANLVQIMADNSDNNKLHIMSISDVPEELKGQLVRIN